MFNLFDLKEFLTKPHVNVSQVYIRATETQRAIISAKAMLAGKFLAAVMYTY